MSQIVKKWLKQHLDKLVTVQGSRVRSEPDLIVQLWSGVQVRIHLLNTEPRTRQIKSALQDASSIGVGTLFLVHRDLIPDNGAQVVLDEWLRALHELTYEQVYVYQLEAMTPSIFPIHFEGLAGMAKYEVHHGEPIDIQHFRFYSRHIRPRYLKGKWLVADFDTPAFWKAHDYRNNRHWEQEARRRAEGRSTRWYTWSTGSTWQTSDGSKDSQPPTTGSPITAYLKQCYEKLGVDENASKEDVKGAFRKLAIQVHPDTSQLPKDEAELRFKILSQAYDYIKSANNWS